MAEKTQYEVTYERDERGWWIASVKGVAGCHTQGKSIPQARKRIREALGLFIGNADTVELIDRPKLPREMRKVVDHLKSARERAEREQEKARELTREAAVTLTKEMGLSVRDAGELLGLSHQRIQQLTD